MKKQLLSNEERLRDHQQKMGCACMLDDLKTYNEWKGVGEVVREGQTAITSLLVKKSHDKIQEEAVRTKKPIDEVFPYKPTKVFCRCQLVEKKEQNPAKSYKSKVPTNNLQFLKKRFYSYAKEERGLVLNLLKIHTKSSTTEEAFYKLGQKQGLNLVLTFLKRGKTYNEQEIHSYCQLKMMDEVLLGQLRVQEFKSFWAMYQFAQALEKNWYSQ